MVNVKNIAHFFVIGMTFSVFTEKCAFFAYKEVRRFLQPSRWLVESIIKDIGVDRTPVLLSGTAVNGSSCWMIMRLNLSWQPTLEVWGSPRTLSSMTERCIPYSEVTHFNTGLYVNLTAESASSSRILR